MSGTLLYIGISQFLKPEIRAGIKKKKIITTLCLVVNTLNEWDSITYKLKGEFSSYRREKDIDTLIHLAMIPKKK
jgi:hypothetical protein